MQSGERPLGEVLVEMGLVSREQLKVAADEESRSGISSWKLLVGRGILEERDLVRARAAQVGIEFVDCRTVKADAQAVALLDADVASTRSVLPIRFEGDALVCATAEPRDAVTMRSVAAATGRRVIAAAAYKPDLDDALATAYPSAPLRRFTPADVGAASAAGGGPAPVAAAVAVAEKPAPEPARPVHAVAGNDMEPNFSEFLDAVIERGASDLHLTAGLGPMMRINGELVPIPGYRSLKPNDIKDLIYSILTQKQREMFEEKLELDVSYSMPGRGRFRVNVFQQRDSVGAVMRLIPFEIRGLEQLGLPASVGSFCDLRRGLVLVTGVTGSGKSTTLAAMIDAINASRAEHIMTVEDPIEFLHRHKKAVVNQREVAHDTHSFANALKHVLRQDPDVILVGEMRDLETISTALTAAETGHLVFGTLHTQDAPQSVDRVIDVFPPHQQQQIRVQLAGTLAGVVSQQLIPTTDGRGRAVAAEVLVATPAVRNLIREGKTHQIYTSMQAGGKFGMQVMDQHLAELVKLGRVGYDMALERCHRVDEFKRLCGRS